MPLTVLGPGLVGSYLGAAAGASRCLVGASRRIHGQRVALPCGERAWQPTPIAWSDLASDGPVLVACRAPDTPWELLPPRSLAAQNGLGQPIPVAVCFLALDLDGDGVVRHHGAAPRIVVPADPAWTTTAAAWRQAGLQVEAVDDVRPAQWEKAILNATVGPLCLALQLSMTEVWHDVTLRSLVLQATDEGVAIAASAGVTIAPGAGHRAIAFFSSIQGHRPSVLKSTNELPWILGALLRQAQRSDIPAPALSRIAELVARRGAAALAGG